MGAWASGSGPVRRFDARFGDSGTIERVGQILCIRQRSYVALWRAAPRFAVKLGRRGKGNLWAPNDALMRAIKGESDER